MAIADRHGIPIGLSVGSASPHEVTLVEKTLDGCFTRNSPEKLIGDKAYDSDNLDHKLLKDRGVELIAPHKSNRQKPPTQDGRALRRYVKRWKIERVFAWLQNSRRILNRFEYKLSNYAAFVKLGILRLLFKYF